MLTINFSTKALIVGAFVTILVFLSGPLGYKFFGTGLQSSLIAILIAILISTPPTLIPILIDLRTIRNHLILPDPLLVSPGFPLEILSPHVDYWEYPCPVRIHN